MTTQHGPKAGYSGQPPFVGMVEPHRQDFSSLQELQTAVPDLRVPSHFPDGAKFIKAVWQFPPHVTTGVNNGKTEIASTDYNLTPSLTWGHISIIYMLSGGSLIIDQGPFTPYLGLQNQQFGPASQRLLPSGRTARTRDISGPGLPPGGIRVVGWIEDGYKIAAIGTRGMLTLDELATIVDSV